MSDDNHGSLLGLNKAGNVVDAALDALVLGLRCGRLGLSLFLQALQLRLLRLGTVLVEHLENIRRCTQHKTG